MEKNKKRTLWVIIVSWIVAVAIVSSLCIITITNNLKNQYDFKNNAYIFNTIEDLNFLNDSVVENNVKDKNLKNSSYSSSRSIQIEYEGNNYRLYAYEFSSIEDFFKYGKAVTGNDYRSIYEMGLTSHYYYGYNAFIFIPISNSMLIFQDANALYVEANGISKKQFNIFLDYLFSNLPQKVELLY